MVRLRQPKIKTLDWDGRPIIIQVVEETASRCSITSTPMQVFIKLIYLPDKKLIELVSFRKFVNWYAARKPNTVEEIADELAEIVYKTAEPKYVAVEVIIKTADHGVALAVTARPKTIVEYYSDVLKIITSMLINAENAEVTLDVH